MSIATVTAGATANLPAAASRAKMRKRFLIAGIGALALLGPVLGVSFLANSGTASPSISASGASGSLTYTACPNATATLFYSTTACTTSPQTAFTPPNWAPTANTAGSVASGGDLGLIDAVGQTSPVILNVYVTNLQALALDYSSFAFAVNVYQCASTSAACPTSGSGAWSPIATWDSANYASTPYLTSSSGYISFSLPAGDWYDVAIDTGGEFYCISTSTSGGASLSPSFFLTSSAT
ncbi:MAG: hypothetical protein EPN30_08030 [Actinomycetota bacterium]|nr:MAG: hypothetical protein EPN30_08030 [Actinomycetota bacterium]